ncbi:hypothetical protein [Brunnivagina elsteri]|uniref:hypothetical protein n=1 Tax=Brunnivagina elsteri TaxID=1247191 RepID=UPI0011789CA7|nr:hypothetical protein [Calothrix elsteri]
MAAVPQVVRSFCVPVAGGLPIVPCGVQLRFVIRRGLGFPVVGGVTSLAPCRFHRVPRSRCHCLRVYFVPFHPLLNNSIAVLLFSMVMLSL